MVYQWKLNGIYPVLAQKAGEELARIYQQHGALEPAQIVEESRSESAPLHPCFEWNDAIAAEKYRETQAGNIIRAIVTVADSNGKQEEVRAFVHVEETYRPIEIVVKSEDMIKKLLTSALNELAAFKRKYNKLSALQPVFTAIDQIAI